MAEMIISGKIIRIEEKRSGESVKTGNKWCVQKYVLETEGEYPKHCVFSVFGEDKINQFNIKQDKCYDVSIEIDAHEYNGAWYNEIRAWKVVLSQSAQQTAPAPAQPATQQEQAVQVAKAEKAFAADNDTEELPF